MLKELKDQGREHDDSFDLDHRDQEAEEFYSADTNPGKRSRTESLDDVLAIVGDPRVPRDVRERVGASYIMAERGHGQTMPESLTTKLDKRIDTDVAQVRVHNDPATNAVVQALGARAFTFGREIFFGTGRYDPSGRVGRKLIAHEVAHVAQHASATPDFGRGGRRVDVGAAGDRHERQADRAAAQMLRGRRAQVERVSAGVRFDRDVGQSTGAGGMAEPVPHGAYGIDRKELDRIIEQLKGINGAGGPAEGIEKAKRMLAQTPAQDRAVIRYAIREAFGPAESVEIIREADENAPRVREHPKVLNVDLALQTVDDAQSRRQSSTFGSQPGTAAPVRDASANSTMASAASEPGSDLIGAGMSLYASMQKGWEWTQEALSEYGVGGTEYQRLADGIANARSTVDRGIASLRSMAISTGVASHGMRLLNLMTDSLAPKISERLTGVATHVVDAVTAMVRTRDENLAPAEDALRAMHDSQRRADPHTAEAETSIISEYAAKASAMLSGLFGDTGARSERSGGAAPSATTTGSDVEREPGTPVTTGGSDVAATSASDMGEAPVGGAVRAEAKGGPGVGDKGVAKKDGDKGEGHDAKKAAPDGSERVAERAGSGGTKDPAAERAAADESSTIGSDGAASSTGSSASAASGGSGGGDWMAGARAFLGDLGAAFGGGDSGGPGPRGSRDPDRANALVEASEVALTQAKAQRVSIAERRQEQEAQRARHDELAGAFSRVDDKRTDLGGISSNFRQVEEEVGASGQLPGRMGKAMGNLSSGSSRFEGNVAHMDEQVSGQKDEAIETRARMVNEDNRLAAADDRINTAIEQLEAARAGAEDLAEPTLESWADEERSGAEPDAEPLSPEQKASAAIEAQLNDGTYDNVVVAHEMAQHQALINAAEQGLIGLDTVDAFQRLSSAMTRMTPQIKALDHGEGHVDTKLKVAADRAAQALYASLSEETKGEATALASAGPMGGSSSSVNPYTGELTTYSIFGSRKAGGVGDLSKHIQAGKWDLALTVYGRVSSNLLDWAAKQTQRRAESTSDEGERQALEAQAGQMVAVGATATELEQLAAKNPTRVGAVFEVAPDVVGEEAVGDVVQQPLMLFYWREDDEWHLRDLTRPGNSFEDTCPARQGETQPPRELFEELNYNIHFPKGIVRYGLSGQPMSSVVVDGEMTWTDYLMWAGIALAAVGAVALTGGLALGAFGAAGATVGGLSAAGWGTVATWAFAGSAIAGTSRAVGDTLQRADHGALDGGTLTLNVLEIVSNMASMGTLAAGKIVVRAGVKAAAGSSFWGRAGAIASKVYVPVTASAMGADGISLVIMGKDTMEQLGAIEGDSAEAKRARLLLIAQLVVTGGMVVLSAKGDLADIRSGADLNFHLVDGVPVVTRAGASLDGAALRGGTPGTMSDDAVRSARARAARGELGDAAPLDEALIQRSGKPRPTDADYGRVYAEVTEELQAKIAAGELTTNKEIIEYMGRRIREAGKRLGRTDASAGDLGTVRPEGSVAYTPYGREGGRYRAYGDGAEAPGQVPGGVVRDGDLEMTEFSDGNLPEFDDMPEGTKPDYGPGWRHTDPSQFDAINAKCDDLLARARGAGSAADKIDAIAEYHWYMAHMMPYARGSAGATDAVVKALLRDAGVKVGRTRVGVQLDLEAINLPKDEFVLRYASFFESSGRAGTSVDQLAARSRPFSRNEDIPGGGAGGAPKAGRYLRTRDVDPTDLPYESAIRPDYNPRPQLANSIDEIPQAKVKKVHDIILASDEHSGSAGLVRLAELDDGTPVVLKSTPRHREPGPDGEHPMLGESRSAQLYSELGIGARFHGVYEDENGVNIVMDLVPGDFKGTPVTEQTFKDIEEMWRRMKGAGFKDAPGDFQPYRTPDGRMVVIDPAQAAKELDAHNAAPGERGMLDVVFGRSETGTPQVMARVRMEALAEADIDLGVKYLDELGQSDPDSWKAIMGRFAADVRGDHEYRRSRAVRYLDYLKEWNYIPRSFEAPAPAPSPAAVRASEADTVYPDELATRHPSELETLHADERPMSELETLHADERPMSERETLHPDERSLSELETLHAAEVSPGSAEVPLPKFSEYIFKDGATHGKDRVFRGLGYGKEHSGLLAEIFERQASQKFGSGAYELGKLDQYGQRIDIEIELPGIGEAAGKTTYLKSGWMIRPDGSIKLNTPFSGFTR